MLPGGREVRLGAGGRAERAGQVLQRRWLVLEPEGEGDSDGHGGQGHC